MKKANTKSEEDRLVILGNLAFKVDEIQGIRAGHDDDDVFIITKYGEYLASGIDFNRAVFEWANGGA